MWCVLRRWRAWLPWLIVVAVAAVLRCVAIGAQPPGLYRDEGYYGLDALNVLRGHFSLYFAANNGREGLYIYLLAPAIAVLGRTAQALRLVSAVVGTLTIAAVYLAGRNLFSHRAGVLSAAVMAVTFWHLALSRVAFRAVTLPLVLCLAVGLAAGVIRRDRAGRRTGIGVLAFLAGAAFGLVFYTYTSGQFVAALVAGFGLAVLMVPSLRAEGRVSRPALAGWVLGAAVALAPLALWLARHAGLYFVRADQVSILSPAINHGDLLGTLLGNIVRAVGMFGYQGDRIWRHNLSLRPVFAGWMILAFFGGVAASAWRLIRRRRPAAGTGTAPPRPALRFASLFVLLWLAVFLIPTILAEDTPHFLRAIGALPAACILAALGLEAALDGLARRGWLSLHTGARRWTVPPAVVAASLLALSGLNTAGDYFGDYVQQPQTAYWLEAHNVSLAATVNDFVAGHPAAGVWLQRRFTDDNPALRFLSPAVEQQQVSLVESGRPGVEAADILLVVDPNHDWSDLRAALPAARILRVKPGPMAQGDRDSAPRRAYLAVYAQPAPDSEGRRSEFEGGMRLERAAIAPGAAPDGSVYTVTLNWSASRPIAEDYAVFVHWMRKGALVAQHDGSPADGYLPMPAWRSGDVVVDEHRLVVPSGYQPGDEIRVGLYRRGENRRLAVLNAGGAPQAEWADITDAIGPAR